jgi:transposase
MAEPWVSDELWEVVEPLIPKHEPSPQGGRPRLDDRRVLIGILFVLKSGIPWEMLPLEMGCGSGMSCGRRLREWPAAGGWDWLHQVLLKRLQAADLIDWSRAIVDSASVRAVGGGEETVPNPTDRAKLGSRHHLLTDAHGLPLSDTLTGANRNDVTQLLPLVDHIPQVAGQPGHPKCRPDSLYADRADDSEPHREQLRDRGIEPHLARRGEAHGSGLGVFRWVSERTLGWLHHFRRRRVRFDRTAEIHHAFLKLAESLICFQTLQRGYC